MFTKSLTKLLLLPLMFAMIIPAISQPSKGKYHSFRLKPGQDLKRELNRFINQNKIQACAIVTCVGSLSQAELRYANESEGDRVEGPLEIISLVGCGGQGKWHLHLSVSDQRGRMSGGHLLDGSIVRTTAEIVIVELEDVVFDREPDPQTGYKELVVKQKK